MQHNKKFDLHKNGIVNKIIRAVIFFMKVVSDLKFGYFCFFRPPLTSVTSEAGRKTSNFNVDFDVEKREEFGVP